MKVIFLLPILAAISLAFFPSFWVYLAVFVDFYTPWVLFESPLYDAYHDFITSRLPERPEIPLPEIPASEASYENVVKLTKDFTFPLVIRGLLADSPAVQNWGNKDWWIERYGDEELLCGTYATVMDNCTVRHFWNTVGTPDAFYVSGASAIFDKHPELHEMMDSEALRALEPCKRIASQVFLGEPGTGSDIHSAMGINIFRMIVGHKKWWFIPPHQTAFLKPSINLNGFSAHAKTLVGKGGSVPSPWLSRLVRYTTVVGPGDVLINPPWFWHGIDNLGQPGEVIIGSPTRYGLAPKPRQAAFKTNFPFTVNGLFTLYRKQTYTTSSFNLQRAIEGNRNNRGAETDMAHKTDIDD